jgi:hypothetical protein
MEKRTTIYLEEADQEAIQAIQDDHAARGVKLTASGAIRFALRETNARIKQTARPKRSEG